MGFYFIQEKMYRNKKVHLKSPLWLFQTILGGNSLRVSGKHGRFSNVIKTQIKHTNSLHTNAAAGVGWTPVAEGINVGFDSFQF